MGVTLPYLPVRQASQLCRNVSAGEQADGPKWIGCGIRHLSAADGKMTSADMSEANLMGSNLFAFEEMMRV